MKIILAAILLQLAGAQKLQLGSIEGKVTQTNGEVVSKVTVTLMESSSPTGQPSGSAPYTVSDADGKFIFPGVKPGSYRLRATRSGFADGEYGQKGPNGTGVAIGLTSGQKLQDINVRVTPRGAITGRIVDRNGIPEVRALVQAWKPVYRDPLQARSLTAVQTTTTDDQGNYRLFWLAPGEYFVTAAPEGTYSILFAASAFETRVSADFSPLTNVVRITGQAEGGTARHDVAAALTYYPGATNLNDATTAVVRAGATSVGIDIGIASVPVHRIRGITVNGVTGRPQSMRVQLNYATESSRRSISHDSSETGAFEFGGLRPGTYVVTAQSAEVLTFAPPIQIGNEDVNNVVVSTLLRGFPINGKISVDGTTSNSTAPGPGFYVLLIPLLSTSLLTPQMSGELRGSEFSFRTVLPGDYRVVIEGNSKLYLKSARLGNQDAMDVIHIPGPTDSPLELEFSSRRGGVDGHVVNERRESVTSAKVVLVPDPPNRQRAAMYLTPSVDASGKFHVDAIPGFYRVFAWEDVEPGIWLDSDFLSINESRGRPLVVSDGRNDGIEVTVIPYVP